MPGREAAVLISRDAAVVRRFEGVNPVDLAPHVADLLALGDASRSAAGARQEDPAAALSPAADASPGRDGPDPKTPEKACGSEQASARPLPGSEAAR